VVVTIQRSIVWVSRRDMERADHARHCLRQTRSVCAREQQRRLVGRSSTSEGGSNPCLRARG